jgi:flagellar biosynthesis protein FlhB
LDKQQIINSFGSIKVITLACDAREQGAIPCQGTSFNKLMTTLLTILFWVYIIPLILALLIGRVYNRCIDRDYISGMAKEDVWQVFIPVYNVIMTVMLIVIIIQDAGMEIIEEVFSTGYLKKLSIWFRNDK